MAEVRLTSSILLTLGLLHGQQLVWQSPATSTAGYYSCLAFSDYDRDGAVDIIAFRAIGIGAQQVFTASVLSGRTGAVLHQRPAFLGEEWAASAGDMDGDGFDEYVWAFGQTIRVYSPRLSAVLFTLPAPPGTTFNGNFGEVKEARIDLDGDGLGDILAATRDSSDSVLYAYNHQGVLRYRIPAAANGWVIRSIANVGDRDGDGGEDYLVGAVGGSLLEGGVFLVSGRTGTLIRGHFGLQQYDLIGGTVGPAGDFDRDGVDDFLSSNLTNLGSNRQITMVWSGTTGAVLRTFVDTSFLLGTAISGKFDSDFDGLPDVSFVCPACQFEPLWYGAVQVMSGRDGSRLQETHPASPLEGYYAYTAAHLGVQTGDPHPVYAITLWDTFHSFWTLQVWRNNPARSTLSGAACATIGSAMVPGLRTTTTGSRVQLANAPAGALAWCILGDGAATTTAGLPLPVGLGPYGFPGCSLNVPLDAVGATLTGTTGIDRGYAAFDLPVAMAATAGRRFAMQWLVLDPATGFEAWTVRRDFWLR